MDRARFLEEIVAWLNARYGGSARTIDADTPLFASGLINSIRILELIAWTERAIGAEIPDRLILMDNFQTARRIADVFIAEREETHVAR